MRRLLACILALPTCVEAFNPQNVQQQGFSRGTKESPHHRIHNQKTASGEALSERLRDVFESTTPRRQKFKLRLLSRQLEDANYAQDDDAQQDDDAVQNDDAQADDDGAQNDDGVQYDDDYVVTVGNEADERCSEFLVSFLEGATDAHDTCEGIMNAYTAAECSASDPDYSKKYDYDDYFEEFAEHQCCQALMAHHREYCEEDRLLSNIHLFAAAAILLLCECAKVLVHKLNLHFLPEAAVCILVGTLCGLFAHLLPFTDISFDDELFLAVLLPPIIFEAALSVSKYEFKRRRGAIFMFSVFGTVISTFSTGLMVHYASKASGTTTFPMLDSLTYGALISSIDPVAILSVLTSLHLNQKDTIFILVFGESLLNDGIAITLFQTLVDRFDGKTNDGSTSVDEVLDALATFLIAMFGSIAVGLACGACAWVYFYFLDRNLPPVMEVGSFFLWALIPYYISDAAKWSGIVSIVAVGFFMDIYIAGPKRPKKEEPVDSPESSEYIDMQDGDGSLSKTSFESLERSVAPLPNTERLHLSSTADRHVRFVAHLTSQLAENAIFAYLGLFLFSKNYEWDPTLVTLGIASCILSRALMVLIVSYTVFQIYKWRGRAGASVSKSSRTAKAIQDPRTQAVLVLAGLRGAVSLALVENVPIYNSNTGEGCEFKQVMKGMTSASILFTTFVFGGGAYYILPHLGITPDKKRTSSDKECLVVEAPPLRHPGSTVV